MFSGSGSANVNEKSRGMPRVSHRRRSSPPHNKYSESYVKNNLYSYAHYNKAHLIKIWCVYTYIWWLLYIWKMLKNCCSTDDSNTGGYLVVYPEDPSWSASLCKVILVKSDSSFRVRQRVPLIVSYCVFWTLKVADQTLDFFLKSKPLSDL